MEGRGWLIQLSYLCWRFLSDVLIILNNNNSIACASVNRRNITDHTIVQSMILEEVNTLEKHEKPTVYVGRILYSSTADISNSLLWLLGC